MKKFLTSFAVILLTCVCILTGCKAKGLKDNPSTDAEVYGGGNIATIKGDYLYYTNGYVDNYTEVYTSKKQNDWGKVTQGAIYRTKLVDGKVEKDDDGFVVKTEVVVPRLVGFENGKFVIIGDYIYYSTPRMREDANGTVRNDYIEFNRVKIDGTNNEAFYTVSSQISTDNWNVYTHNGSTYLVLVETVDSKNVIKSVNVKSGKTITLSQDISSWALTSQNVLEDEDGYENKYVYFTRSILDSDDIVDSGNVIVKADITNGNQTAKTYKQNTAKTIVAFENNNLYFSIANGSYTDLYVSDVTLNNTNMSEIIKNSNYSKFYVLKQSTISVIGVDSNNNVDYITDGSIKQIINGSITIIDIVGSDILYIDSNSNLMLKSYTTDDSAVSLMSDDKTYLINSLKVDVTRNKVYLFASYTAEDESTNYYLNYIDLNTKGDGSFVGKFEKDHTPAKPEATTDEESGEEITPPWIV